MSRKERVKAYCDEAAEFLEDNFTDEEQDQTDIFLVAVLFALTDSIKPQRLKRTVEQTSPRAPVVPIRQPLAEVIHLQPKKAASKPRVATKAKPKKPVKAPRPVK